ncbi:hypothetical protein Ddye_012890 [Dipteronia dyeriana]|uniref:Uncharacterized protein n=1 Tax=Dipteronia dyeriana TaxID=168575 RepID=A0AAE0CJ38_9ROSI|nr:hypothetical protein Ddye_012890 [Dipteronia dyeriana]
MEKTKGKKIVSLPEFAIVDQSKEVEQSEPIILTAEMSRKRPHQDDSSTKDVVAKFPVDISVFSYPSQMLKEVDQLLFPKDEACFSQIGASRVVEWGFMGAFQEGHKFLVQEGLHSHLFEHEAEKKVEKAKSDSERFAKESSKKLSRVEEEIARLEAIVEASET